MIAEKGERCAEGQSERKDKRKLGVLISHNLLVCRIFLAPTVQLASRNLKIEARRAI
jgi:hypothetical protein